MDEHSDSRQRQQFAAHLNDLFAAQRRPDGLPYTLRAVGMATGCAISAHKRWGSLWSRDGAHDAQGALSPSRGTSGLMAGQLPGRRTPVLARAYLSSWGGTTICCAS